MARETFISPLNPHPMRPVDSQRPARYKHGHLDTEWQKDLVLSFQLEALYRQKVERGIRFRFQAKVTPNTSHTLTVIDCRGVTVLTIAQSASYVLPGDLTTDGTQLTTYHYRLPDLSAITEDGTYYLLFTVVYDGSHSAQFISEPFELADEHPGTMLLEYTHSENKEGMLFEQIPAQYAMLVEGYISGFNPKSASTVYQDQEQDTETLDFTAYRSWKFYAGQSGEGLPDWMLDKLNRILGCDKVLFNGKQYTAASANPQWNIEGAETTPLKAADVEIQEANNGEGFTFSDGTLDLFTPPAFPYAIGFIQIGSFTIAENLEIADSTAQTAAIAAINAGLSDRELLGTVALSGGVLRYEQGAGENYQYVNVNIHTNKVGFVFTHLGGLTPLAMAFTIANVMVNWGDGVNTSHSSFVTATTASHLYGSSGTYQVTVWGTFKAMAATSADLDYSSGTFPAGLVSLTLSGVGFPSNNLPFAAFANTKATLATLTVTDAGLTTATGSNPMGMPLLKNINLSGNNFNTTVRSAFHFDVWQNANAYNISNGAFSIVQLPLVPLNATGNTYKGLLQAAPRSWTVNS